MAGPFGASQQGWLDQQEMAYFSPPQMEQTMLLNSPPAVDMFINAVYYPNWAIYNQKSPSLLNVDVVSHIFYAFASIKEDGTVYVSINIALVKNDLLTTFKLSDEWADTQIEVDGTQGCLRSLSQLKQRRGGVLKTILSIGGGTGSENFASAARTTITRDRFARTAKELCLEYNLDGIDIDWEHPKNLEEGQNYVRLLATIRAWLPRPRFLLTSALPAGQWALRNIYLAAAHDFLDLLLLMAYDFCGPWTEKAGHQAQLQNIVKAANEHSGISGHSGVSYLISHDVPSYKILLGLPTYGRSFLGADEAGQKFRGHGGEDGFFQYRDLPRPGSREYVDPNYVGAYCVGGDGGFVTYDNPETVKMKAEYVKKHALAGLFFWTGVGDSDSVQRSLVYQGFQALHSVG
ncbi:MAG: hypothetical protein M1820_007266 [Bogoriella megaspora]|nr:MAG: hypothetical protein M1820_007266 [Bogoriella megaspora]